MAVEGPLAFEDKSGLIRAEEVVTRSFSEAPTGCSLKMVSQGRHFVWTPSKAREKFVVGRSEASNLVIKNDIASRIHGYFTIIDKGCIYIDQSSNGSFIRMGGKLTKLHKEGTVLHGPGTIFIGSDPGGKTVDESLIIEFDVSMT